MRGAFKDYVAGKTRSSWIAIASHRAHRHCASRRKTGEMDRTFSRSLPPDLLKLLTEKRRCHSPGRNTQRSRCSLVSHFKNCRPSSLMERAIGGGGMSVQCASFPVHASCIF